MASCKECVHADMCRFYTEELAKTKGITLGEDIFEYFSTGDVCEHFKDRSLFVELPCSTSETLFVIEDSGEIIIDKVETIVTIGYDEDFSQSRLDCYSGKHYLVKDIGKTVFLTREEAEKALKEREENAH